MKKIIFTLILINFNICYAKCNFENLTDDSLYEQRHKIFNDLENSGVRVAWQDMKKMNKDYLSGTVDTVVLEFEKSFCDNLETQEVKDRYPGANIEIKKMDFKGYYITCTPKEKCLGIDLEARIERISPPKFPKTSKVLEAKTFEFVAAKAENYQEGYIRARVKVGYPEYDGKNPELHTFIKNELDLSIREVFGISDLSQLENFDEQLKAELRHNLALFRSGNGAEEMDPKYKKIALALDVLMETPYAGSNNFHEELKKCINGTENKTKRFSFCTAQSGDDMNIFVKKDGAITKVVAVDARGLGTLNMMKRLEEYVDYTQKGGNLNHMHDVFNVSNAAILKADEQMKFSMKEYVDNIKRSFDAAPHFDFDIDQTLRFSQDTYNNAQKGDHRLMQMRAGVIELCGDDTKCLLNRMTIIHNNLKLLENKDYNGHFGDSCVGTEYWVRKLGAKGILEVGP